MLEAGRYVELPSLSITTTAGQILQGDNLLESVTFRNGSTTGTIYIRNSKLSLTEVTSTDREVSLGPGDAVTIVRSQYGPQIVGPWRAISDGTVTLEILPSYKSEKRF